MVASVTVVNDTEFSVGVRVTDDGDGGWVSLTTVGDGSTSEVEDVLDQGDVWTFAFTAQGHEAGELTLTVRSSTTPHGRSPSPRRWPIACGARARPASP